MPSRRRLAIALPALVLAGATAACGNAPQPDVATLPAADRARYVEARSGIEEVCALDSSDGRSGVEYRRLAEDLHTVIRLSRRYPNATAPGVATLREGLAELEAEMAACDRKSARRIEVALRTIG